MNNVTLLGRIGSDLELRQTASGVSNCSFALAVPRGYVKQGEERETDWISCVAWRATADFICNHFRKGNSIAVIGELQTRTYADKDGKNHKVTEVVLSKAFFTGEKKSADNNTSPAVIQFEDAAGMQEVFSDDDLPF